jgi:hypothetical protein
MLGAMLPGIFPDIVLVLVENERRVSLRDPPSALFDLTFELASDRAAPTVRSTLAARLWAGALSIPDPYASGLQPLLARRCRR